jgi:hypothetical protein
MPREQRIHLEGMGVELGPDGGPFVVARLPLGWAKEPDRIAHRSFYLVDPRGVRRAVVFWKATAPFAGAGGPGHGGIAILAPMALVGRWGESDLRENKIPYALLCTRCRRQKVATASLSLFEREQGMVVSMVEDLARSAFRRVSPACLIERCRRRAETEPIEHLETTELRSLAEAKALVEELYARHAMAKKDAVEAFLQVIDGWLEQHEIQRVDHVLATLDLDRVPEVVPVALLRRTQTRGPALLHMVLHHRAGLIMRTRESLERHGWSPLGVAALLEGVA